VTARRSQRGGAAIVVAFMLLTLMAALGFATCRNLDRELAMLADAQRGARAADAAESGLAWFLARAAVTGVPCPLAAPAGMLDEDPASGFRQDFELRVRCLGGVPQTGTGAGAGPAERLWQVTAIGHCGARGQTEGDFIQVRELVVAVAGGPGRRLRILSWRRAGYF